MYMIRYIEKTDKAFWFTVDKSIDELTFENKVRDYQAYIFEEQRKKIGLLRYSLFGDNIPYCNLLFISENYRRLGCGKALLHYWEQDMKARGYQYAMASSRINDEIHLFYRKMGYREIGGIIIPEARTDSTMEILMLKPLRNS